MHPTLHHFSNLRAFFKQEGIYTLRFSFPFTHFNIYRNWEKVLVLLADWLIHIALAYFLAQEKYGDVIGRMNVHT